jgi:hypothetical protein
VEPIFEAVLANDPSRITPTAAARRIEEDLLVTELPHQLYRGDTPLHLAAAGLRYDAACALLAAGTPVNAVNRRGAATKAGFDPAAPSRRRHPVGHRPQRHPAADRIQSQALRQVLAVGQL